MSGPDSDRVTAFTRSAGRTRMLVAVARHFAPKTKHGEHWPNGWNVELTGTSTAGLRDALGGCAPGGEALTLSHLWTTLPIALLIGE